ncbi:DUF427 domain-containing protein [Mycolicibacterium baixiangningiae]|uniref:DUF427 domain-containing protein n=1 Tax=Mycolicibacterium baixiangningiae TaxID=2761578 RepID=UPI001865EDB9|nr:DUF427 domain-containing protein [Mycolicibacterium baixiangningiae]
MTLTAGRGPLSADPAGWFTPALADGAVFAEPHPRRVVAVQAGRTVIDTEDVVMVHRRGHPLRYAFRPDAVGDLRGTPVAEAPGYVHVPWDAVDTWFEEGRELVHYPPNPYHRVDCRPTDRGLRVTVAGTVLVDTTRTVVVFETALAPVLYVDPAHVRVDLLRPSATTSYCNYKGWATYWSAVTDDAVTDDVAWSYPDPLPESRAIAGFLSFDPARAEVLAELPAAAVGADCGCET